MKKFAVVLSGCGYLDGAEITESVSTLIALGNYGASYEVFAPDISAPTVDHKTATPEDGKTHNVVSQAARIARGKVTPLSQLKESNFDGLIFPGGFGAAKVLSNWAQTGSKATVLPEVSKAILSFYEASKPIGAICIAPTLVAKVIGNKGVSVTIGVDKETAAEIEKTGAIHEDCEVTEYITDRSHKVVTTPAYMYDDAKPSEVFEGISKAIKELVEMS